MNKQKILENAVRFGFVNESNDLFHQIENSFFEPISDYIWDSIQNDGWDEELDDFEKSNYSYIILNIPEADSQGLKKFENEIVEKYNSFDIDLKDKYGTQKYLDFIDYDDGKIFIIKHTK